jgi:hypothetical protein
VPTGASTRRDENTRNQNKLAKKVRKVSNKIVNSRFIYLPSAVTSVKGLKAGEAIIVDEIVTTGTNGMVKVSKCGTTRRVEQFTVLGRDLKIT